MEAGNVDVVWRDGQMWVGNCGRVNVVCGAYLVSWRELYSELSRELSGVNRFF